MTIVTPGRREFLKMSSTALAAVVAGCGTGIVKPSDTSINTKEATRALFFGKGEYASDVCDENDCYGLKDPDPIWSTIPFETKPYVELTHNIEDDVVSELEKTLNTIREMTHGKVNPILKRTIDYSQAPPVNNRGVKIIKYNSTIPNFPGGGAVINRDAAGLIDGSFVMYDARYFLNHKILLSGFAHELAHTLLGWHHFNCNFFALAGESVMNSGKNCTLASGPPGFSDLDIICSKRVYGSIVKPGNSQSIFDSINLT